MQTQAVNDFNVASDQFGRMIDRTIDELQGQIASLRRLRATLIELGASMPEMEAVASKFAPPKAVAK